MLLPTAMHPWMEPLAETRLWPHGYRAVYEAYNRIFNCQGHGWSNLQSTHLNIGFHGDEEFGRLHAAIRLLLPILPALAASSPLVDGRVTGIMDNRLAFYLNNQKSVPSVAGLVIPEAVFTEQGYRDRILSRTYRDIAPHDPAGILQEEWLNSRGAIARFERSAIEIRLLDVQECPLADLAICGAILAVIEMLVKERLSPFARQASWREEPLRLILDSCIRDADQALIASPEYLATLGLDGENDTAIGIWRRLIEKALPSSFMPPECEPALEMILSRGPLSRRILAALGKDTDRACLADIYRRLCSCLADNTLFLPEAHG